MRSAHDPPSKLPGEPDHTSPADAAPLNQSTLADPPIVVSAAQEHAPPGGAVVDGTFRIERKLGAGGMGVVYLARDLSLHRDVALKLHGATGDDADERALREAKVMARLSHPNVVTVYEVGTHGRQLFIAMEYVDGGTLRG